MNLAELRARSVDLAFGAGWGAVKALPGPVAARVFAGGGDLAVRRDGLGVQQLRRNLRRVVGPSTSAAELEELVRDGMRSYARYWLETFRLPKMNHREVARIADDGTEGREHVDVAMAAGRGLVIALPHMGNWDAAAIWLIDHGVPFTTVVERLQPESLFDRFVAYRESLGMEVLPLTGGARASISVLTERLAAGGCVCLVADRDLSRGGVTVQFFGEAATMPPGPAMLASMTGAALVPVTLSFRPGGWGQRIEHPVDLGTGRLRDRVQSGTQALADVFAREIAKRPQDWHMLQRLWLADRTESSGRAERAMSGR